MPIYPRPIEVFGDDTQSDTFDIQRQKINQLSADVGNIEDLTTPVTTDVVEAVNSVNDAIAGLARRTWIRAIAAN